MIAQLMFEQGVQGQCNSSQLKNVVMFFGHRAVSLCLPGLCSQVLLEDRTWYTVCRCHRNLLPLCRQSQNVCGVCPLPNRWVTVILANLQEGYSERASTLTLIQQTQSNISIYVLSCVCPLDQCETCIKSPFSSVINKLRIISLCSGDGCFSIFTS